MRTQNFSMLFTLALVALVASFIPSSAIAQTTPVANGYELNYMTNVPMINLVPTDGFPGFCGVGGGQEILIQGQITLNIADTANSLNTFHGGPRSYLQTIQNNIVREGHACATNNLFMFVWNDLNGSPTLRSLRLGDKPTLSNLIVFTAPGQPFNYAGGSATYLDGYTITANYGRIILTGKFDAGFGPHTLVFEIYSGAPPALRADLGTDQAVDAVVTSSTVYVKQVTEDHSTEYVMAIPYNTAPFKVAELDGISTDDLTAPPYAHEELVMAASKTTATFSVRQGNHLVIQTLADGSTSPFVVLDTAQVGDYPVARVNSVAIADNKNITFVMQTLVPADDISNGGQASVYRIDSANNLTKVLTEGLDIGHIRGTQWSVFSNGNLTVASNYLTTYQIIDPQ
ncbi:MAG: hypothetical protein P4L74_02025 [Candidatus Doudnabacteria bacterium]|nr:hypothetical protein [Candidatus Doudnabacteria bacterium]